LSDFLDRELSPTEQAEVEAHLAECGACATLLGELRRVIARAEALEERPPRADLWPGVAAAIGATPAVRRRISFSIPQLLAAGIALVVLTSMAAGFLLRGRARAVAGREAPAPTVVLAGAQVPSGGYAGAVAELEAELARGRGRLDTATVRVLQDNLALVDRAIGEAERALAADPGNAYVSGHLARTRLRKLGLLRQATALTHVTS
jgi:anti-sigma factor RsiW